MFIVVVALISSVWPSKEESFFELGLLSENKTAEAYFADEHSAVEIGESNLWFIYVNNHMDASKYIQIRIKLLSSIMQLPNDQENQPSSAISFFELPMNLSVDEPALIPFSWSIMKSEIQNGSVIINSLVVNGRPVEIFVSGFVNSYFRIVLELWVYDPNSQQFKFGWESNEGFSSASIWMGFKLNITTT